MSATARHYTLNGKEILGYGQMEKIDIPDNNNYYPWISMFN
jgi:hypothetical protein